MERIFIQVILPLRLEWEPCYGLPEGISAAVGDRVRVLFAHKEYVGVVSRTGVPPQTEESRIQDILSVEKELPAISPGEIRFWQEVSDYYLCTCGEVYKAAYPMHRTGQEETQARQKERLETRLAALESKLEKARKDETRERYREEAETVKAALEGRVAGALEEMSPLSPAQQRATEEIRSAFREGKTALLKGATGSGKTRIYLELARDTLLQGKSVLYLVPEIALSRQLEDRIGRFCPGVQVFHSGISTARRSEVARHCRSGAPYLVLGTRSSLFLPHRNLGLVIVDEEHDTSYKQDAPAPRYHARETAIMLALVQGAHVVLGSATPSLESLYNARSGRFVQVDLPERFYDSPPAQLMLIDTVAERRKRGMVGSLSRKLLAAIQKTLSEGGQALILRARRSYAPVLQCPECGSIPRCPRCNVPLSLHKDPMRMVCHYCGHTEPYTGLCPKCGSALQPLGAGTQKIEEELRELFPQARIARLDSDTPSGEETHLIRQFSRGEIDLLVGTQIITKGFDFEGLRLVAVLQADSLWGQQDFRADERAFQLLEQFRGRSGRRTRAGLLVIQTRCPEHPVFARLEGDQDETLLEQRRLFGYPPFTRIVQIVVRDTNPKRLDALGRAMKEALPRELSVIGPYAPAVDRIAGESIVHFRVMLPRDKALTRRKRALYAAVTRFEKERKYSGHITLDVDPV